MRWGSDQYWRWKTSPDRVSFPGIGEARLRARFSLLEAECPRKSPRGLALRNDKKLSLQRPMVDHGFEEIPQSFEFVCPHLLIHAVIRQFIGQHPSRQ